MPDHVIAAVESAIIDLTGQPQVGAAYARAFIKRLAENGVEVRPAAEPAPDRTGDLERLRDKHREFVDAQLARLSDESDDLADLVPAAEPTPDQLDDHRALIVAAEIIAAMTDSMDLAYSGDGGLLWNDWVLPVGDCYDLIADYAEGVATDEGKRAQLVIAARAMIAAALAGAGAPKGNKYGARCGDAECPCATGQPWTGVALVDHGDRINSREANHG